MSYTCLEHGWTHLLNPCPHPSHNIIYTATTGNSGPREWGIRLPTLIINSSEFEPWPDKVHVIEYSAYEALKAENESLKKERTAYRTLNSLMGDNGVICELHDDIEALQAKLALAIEAMRQSRNRSDDYGDSWCSQPIREFLKQLEGEE